MAQSFDAYPTDSVVNRFYGLEGVQGKFFSEWKIRAFGCRLLAANELRIGEQIRRISAIGAALGRA